MELQTKVVLVDWSKGATKSESADGTSDRLQAANNALMVGRVVACFVQRIISTYGVPEESVHIFGHSMGAQIMGQAATWLSESSRIRIGKGTGESREYHYDYYTNVAQDWSVMMN